MTLTSGGGGGGGDNTTFLLSIILPVVISVVIGITAICAAYHIYYKEKSDQDHRAATYAGLNAVAIGTRI